MRRVRLPDRLARLQIYGKELSEARADHAHVDRPGNPGIEQPVERLARAGDRQAVIAAGDHNRNSDIGDSAAHESDVNDHVLWGNRESCCLASERSCDVARCIRHRSRDRRGSSQRRRWRGQWTFTCKRRPLRQSPMLGNGTDAPANPRDSTTPRHVSSRQSDATDALRSQSMKARRSSQDKIWREL
jgi:hypothetical protein